MCRRHRELDWQKYIDGMVQDREQYELALAECPDCFQEFIELLGSAMETPPQDFVDGVMAAIPGESKKPSFRPLLHYLVAACLTLVFLELGAFDWISNQQLNPEVISGLMEGLDNFFGTLISNLGGM